MQCATIHTYFSMFQIGLLQGNWIDVWHDDYCNYCYNGGGEDKYFWLQEGYKECKAQIASINEQLMPIAWHPSRWWDWYVPENEKQETEKLWR